MLQFIQVVDFLYTNILVMECKLFMSWIQTKSPYYRKNIMEV
jgi:hypothetical protein